MNNALLLVDGNALMHRAYHGMSRGHFQPMHEGIPVSMAYGFASTILNALHHFNPRNIVVTFDTKEKTFRHEMDPNYKAHRDKAPDDFYPQLPYIHAFIEKSGIPSIGMPGYESDDLIGSLATQLESQFEDIFILSGDLDFLQLVNDTVKLIKWNGKIEDAIHYGPKETHARYDITPEQMIDFKAITGDSSDNYKGVPGVGPKTAAKLLNQYDTISGIYDHIDDLKKTLHTKFTDYKNDLYHCQTLARIKTDIECGMNLNESFEWNKAGSKEFFDTMNFPSLTRRMEGQQAKTIPKQRPKEENTDQISLF